MKQQGKTYKAVSRYFRVAIFIALGGMFIYMYMQGKGQDFWPWFGGILIIYGILKLAFKRVIPS